MLQSSSGQKWKKCKQMLLFIHYWGYTSLEVKVQYGGLPVDRVVVLQRMLRYGWLLHHPSLAAIPVFLQSRLQSPLVLDHGRGQELLVKEALHIQMTPSEECYNWDKGLKSLVAWPLWWGDRKGGAILTNLQGVVTYMSCVEAFATGNAWLQFDLWPLKYQAINSFRRDNQAIKNLDPSHKCFNRWHISGYPLTFDLQWCVSSVVHRYK